MIWMGLDRRLGSPRAHGAAHSQAEGGVSAQEQVS